jgi:hypothetical protein
VSTAAVETTTIEHLDKDWDVPCTTEHPSPERANWVLWWSCTCPPASILTCAACKDSVMGAPLVVCDECGTKFAPGSTAVRLIEPLNRRPL